MNKAGVGKRKLRNLTRENSDDGNLGNLYGTSNSVIIMLVFNRMET